MEVDGLVTAIASSLSVYGQGVTSAVSEIGREKAKKAERRLREESPVRSGKYARSWHGGENNRWTGRAQTYIVRSLSRYQLTHLLERGHAKRGGGRTAPRVHIRPVEEAICAEFAQEVEEAIRNGI